MIRLSIRRPVAVSMVYLSVALLGIWAWRGIPIELLPDASFPNLSLSVSWAGASPETMEARVTSRVESAVQQVRGVERITSTTREGSANIQVEFARSTDMDLARMELMERITTVEETLPDAVSPIQVQAYVPREFQRQAQAPLLSYTFTGPLLLEALRSHLEREVVPELLRVPGVADVEVSGGRARVIRIELDEDEIASLGLTTNQVSGAIRDLELVREAGAVRQGDREFALTIRNRPTTAADLRQALLPLSGTLLSATPLVLDDVARIRDGFEDHRSHHRIDGRPAVSMRVHQARGANTVRTAEQVRERVDELGGLGPGGTRFELLSDQSVEIEEQLHSLGIRALLAAGVIFLVLLVFLRSLRTAFIVFSTIAFSILIAVNLIWAQGMTLNLLTLMGLALGFGLIVDNSIVVLENIWRQGEEGGDPEASAEKGARDVILPILASTLTTLIVFLPFLYLQGELRVFYLPLAIVVALTLVASIFVAFTYIPSLAARLLGHRTMEVEDGTPSGAAASEDASPSRADDTFGDDDPRLRRLPRWARRKTPLYIQFYEGLLSLGLRFPWVTVAIVVACFGGSWWVFDNHVNRGMIWGGGQGMQRTTISVTVTLPRGADLARVDALARRFEDRLARMPEVSRFETTVQGERASILVHFQPEHEYTAIPLVVEDRLTSYAMTFSGIGISVRGDGPGFSAGGRGGASPNYRITILGYNFDHLEEIARDLGDRLEGGHTRVHNLDTNATGGGWGRDRATEFVALVDREAAAAHGISSREASQHIAGAARSATPSGRMVLEGDDVQYEVRLAGYREMDVSRIADVVVGLSTGARVSLGDLFTIEERPVMSSILREDQQYERTVAYEFRGPPALGDHVRDQELARTILPAGYQIRERSPWQIGQEEEDQFILVLLVSLGLIFMVTAGLFESVRQPLCVLLAVPMALIGVFLIFFFVDASFTREAYVGVIVMGGVVVNNAILLVDHVNRVRRESGLGLTDAIIRGTLERVRPILMTTATTVLGLLPLVLFMPSADATIWNALTYALIGGLLSSTLFVLTITPSLYLLLERFGRDPVLLEEPSRTGPSSPPGGLGGSGAPALQPASPRLSV
ncbi:MAG: efflux RND transporter permease subunit [Gemmatimonadales bacterium]|nr:MAG: efflux RND transporter permease subunit [Gemmatimonadales bacterium]